MTESEWLTATDPNPMLEFLKSKASERKIRLFCTGCCRRIWHLLLDERCHRGVVAVERWVDREITCSEWECAEHEVRAARLEVDFTEHQQWDATTAVVVAISHAATRDDLVRMAVSTADCVRRALTTDNGFDEPSESRCQTKHLRDIFGNPFRPVAVDPSWLTSTVVALSKGIYEDRAFDRMPILADALQDAGCDNDDLLSHLRSEGPHYRGCWALDLVLAKS